MNRHNNNIHLKIRRYSCQKCNYTCNEKYAIKNHKLVRKYICNECQNSYSTKENSRRIAERQRDKKLQ